MKNAVIVISSHVARGSVGNRAAVFALETLSVPVWAVPTIMLPWHPGHGPATAIVPDEKEFGAFLDDIGKAPWLSEVSAILSGYLANEDQVSQIASLVTKVIGANPGLQFLCDPVIGDLGSLYVSEKIAHAIRDQLLPLADIATPNVHELEWLTGLPASKSPEDAARAARKLGPELVLATSCPGPEPGTIGNLLHHPDGNWLASHEELESPPKGPGDLTSSIYLGHQLQGRSPQQALEKTTASVLEILTQSTRRGSDELMLETDAESIRNPSANIHALPFP